jgi:hemerythrin
METGHPIIDRDHQQIVTSLNQLEAALNREALPQELEKFILFLEGYAREHFAREEAYMLKAKCPAHSENCQAHALFQSKLDGWVKEIRAAGANKTLALNVYIETSKWICRHIFSVDCKLRACSHHAETAPNSIERTSSSSLL